MTIDPERLAAYADGQLPPDEAARVAAAIAADPALSRQVAAHRALRATLSAHFAPILDESVPPRLAAMLEASRADEAEGDDNVIDFGAMLAARARPAPRRWMMGGAIAASLALGLVLGTQVPRGGLMRESGGHLVAEGALDRALTGQLAGESGGDTRILLSFRDARGGYCRGFETGGTAGIACRADGHWAIVRSQSGGASEPAGDFRQAGSQAAQIMAAAQDMATGPALDPEAERTARDAGWAR
jgi:hypothetical protein